MAPVSPLKRALRNAPVALKIALAPTWAMLCLVLMAGLGLMVNHALFDALLEVGEVRVARSMQAKELRLQLTTVHSMVNQSLAWEGVGAEAAVIQKLDQRIMGLLDAYDAALKSEQADTTLSEARIQTLAQAAKAFAKYRKQVADALDIKTGMVASAATYISTMETAYDEINTALTQIIKEESESISSAISDADALAKRNDWTIAIGMLLSLLASVLLSWKMAKIIVSPLSDAVRMSSELSMGRLTARSRMQPSTDATGRMLASLDHVAQSLNLMVQDIRTTANQVGTATSEISSGVIDLSARTEAAAERLQHTAGSIENLSEHLQRSAASAQQADTLARDASRVAQEGGEVVAAAIASMDEIDQQARRIGEIVGVINGIAFQTNILALNAAVEAARAGEQGRGFAVVASEVRMLAQRSAEAAKEIRVLIESSQLEVQTGVKKVKDAGQTMDRVVSAITQVSQTVEDISQASVVQAQGMGQLSEAIHDMDQTTQQNAALVEQAGAATESLEQQTRHLVQMLARFQTAAELSSGDTPTSTA